jgi:hypothetical protein
LNLDADLEHEDPLRYRPDERIRARIAQLRKKLSELVGPHDVVLELDPLPEERRELVALAFSPTTSARARIARLGLNPPEAPAPEILRAVNDRRFCAALGQTLEGAAFVHDMPALERCVRGRSPSGDFLIKRPFSFAGRDRRRAISGLLDASTRGFCERSFARGEGLQVEPWVERLGDFALHGYVQRTGALLVGPVMTQTCDAIGRWQGSAEAPPDALDPSERRALATSLEQAAEALSKAGYFGPFGVDAFRYRDAHGAARFNPRCEINARFSMGYPRELLLRALHTPGT